LTVQHKGSKRSLTLVPNEVKKMSIGALSRYEETNPSPSLGRHVIEVLQRYLAPLQQRGLQVAPTTPLPVHTKAGGHVAATLSTCCDRGSTQRDLPASFCARLEIALLMDSADGVVAHAGGAVRSVFRWSRGQQFGKAGRCQAAAAKGEVQCAR
jgi:hypothetical protein